MRLRHLFEQKVSEVAIIFGRFNPPHKGHRAAWETAATKGVWYVGTNQSTVGPKDPLPYNVKVECMKVIFPEVAEHIVAETSWLTLASQVYKQHGAVRLIIVTDEEWVVPTVQEYNGKPGPHGDYNFPEIRLFHDSIEQAKAELRKSSATSLRDAVTRGDRQAFSDAAGVSAEIPVMGKPFFDLVAEYLLPYADKAKAKADKAKKKPEVKKKEEPKKEKQSKDKDMKISDIMNEQGVAEGHADQQRKIFKKNGEPVGEVGIDRESSPGNGQWYMKCYAYDIDNSGYDSYEEAVAELKHCMKQGVAEAGNKPLEKSRIGTGDTRTPRDIKSQMQSASDEFVKSTADSKTGPFHSKVAKMQGKMAKSELRRRDQGVAEGMYRRPGSPSAYDRDYASSVSGMGKRQSQAYQADGGANDEDHESDRRREREAEMGPWYLRIDGKILKSRGEIKMFDYKKGANNYALAILKNKPELQGKIMLTKSAEDK